MFIFQELVNEIDSQLFLRFNTHKPMKPRKETNMRMLSLKRAKKSEEDARHRALGMPCLLAVLNVSY